MTPSPPTFSLCPPPANQERETPSWDQLEAAITVVEERDEEDLPKKASNKQIPGNTHKKPGISVLMNFHTRSSKKPNNFRAFFLKGRIYISTFSFFSSKGKTLPLTFFFEFDDKINTLFHRASFLSLSFRPWPWG